MLDDDIPLAQYAVAFAMVCSLTFSTGSKRVGGHFLIAYDFGAFDFLINS